MRSTVFFGLLAAFVSMTASAGAAPETTPVPRAMAPTVDGTLSPGEWDKARVEKLTNGGEVLLQHDGDFLYVGIRVPAGGIGSICVDSPPVRVLHASAALGTARYEQEGTDSRSTRSFVFELRDTGASAEAMAQRARFLAAEAWFASTARQGEREREYQISWKLGAARGLHLAVVYMTFPGERLHVWPAALADASVHPELVKGNAPERAQFEPETWAFVAPG